MVVGSRQWPRWLHPKEADREIVASRLGSKMGTQLFESRFHPRWKVMFSFSLAGLAKGR